MATDRPGSLAEALLTLQTRLPRITKDATADTGKYSYSYANLSSITATVAPVLAELGLYWVCCPTIVAKHADAERFVLAYELRHVSGGVIEGWYPLPEGTPQTIGGAITYARRYALCAVLGIAPAEDDDDAQAAEADDARGSTWQAPANPRTRKATRERDTASETTAWNAEDGENAAGTILPAQLQQIGILFGKLGVHDRNDRLALTVKYLNRTEPLASSKALSMADGSRLIQILQQETEANG